MKSITPKLVALALVAATATGIAAFPLLKQAHAIQTDHSHQTLPQQAHRIEVVFILDTTSSMSGLIQAAKEKIWSIATTMASARQNPDIKMGLVAYRDRGDAYVTRVFDLSQDLDSMYAQLMDFRAQGGGDGPESVNQALYDAIHKVSWSAESDVYRVAFLVGDAPPHMDYPDDVKYPATLAAAKRNGIIVNTIQSGQWQVTRPTWQRIAALGKGSFFQVEDDGNAVAVSTPFDAKLSQLAAELEDTRLYYGDAETKQAQQAKLEANQKLHREMSPEAAARRATFNATKSGEANFLGENELVDAISSGSVELNDIETSDLPASLQAVAPAKAMELITEQAQKRDLLKREIEQLSESRDRFIQSQIEAEGGARDSLDEKLYHLIKNQAESVGITYDSENARY